MYVLGPRILALPLCMQLRRCGHFAAATPEDHDVKECERRVNVTLGLYFANEWRRLDQWLGLRPEKG